MPDDFANEGCEITLVADNVNKGLLRGSIATPVRVRRPVSLPLVLAAKNTPWLPVEVRLSLVPVRFIVVETDAKPQEYAHISS
ncbi:hypothetical protein CYMTET_14910 [Cymbomonas tetramitiformis]|uniref:Uncharacterized protein n=1 Tax=Cymbomonas tetramitiformis TaxID=36881 RepID=A0AAE0GFC5_9CHLO|nr:hypothetical protein CYMTET_14910 [Cymbomonas tetramitiformis]